MPYHITSYQLPKRVLPHHIQKPRESHRQQRHPAINARLHTSRGQAAGRQAHRPTEQTNANQRVRRSLVLLQVLLLTADCGLLQVLLLLLTATYHTLVAKATSGRHEHLSDSPSIRRCNQYCCRVCVICNIEKSTQPSPPPPPSPLPPSTQSQNQASAPTADTTTPTATATVAAIY